MTGRPVGASGGEVGGTLRYPEINLDYSIRKSVQTGRVKEARKPPVCRRNVNRAADVPQICYNISVV